MHEIGTPGVACAVRTSSLYATISVRMAHATTGESFAQERHPTLWFLKRPHQGYHIDYCFLPRAWLSSPVAVWVGQAGQWLAHSDHAPLIVSASGNDPHGDGSAVYRSA